MSQKGLLTVVSGFSGAGKGTLMKALLAKYADRYALSISATTRGPREGEQDGREYFFLKKEEFEQMIEEDALIEHAQYVGNYYGTPKKYVMEQREAGKDGSSRDRDSGCSEGEGEVPGYSADLCHSSECEGA